MRTLATSHHLTANSDAPSIRNTGHFHTSYHPINTFAIIRNVLCQSNCKHQHSLVLEAPPIHSTADTLYCRHTLLQNTSPLTPLQTCPPRIEHIWFHNTPSSTLHGLKSSHAGSQHHTTANTPTNRTQCSITPPPQLCMD